MDRGNHYEAAFEAYLQESRLCYVAVDERRRAILGEAKVKCLDFIVHGDAGARLLVDVKGRRFPSGREGRLRRVWHCWSMREDIEGLSRWAEQFGADYQALLVFAYHLHPSIVLPADTDDLWTWRGGRYLLRAVSVDAYRQHARVRSPRWDTVDVPGAIFRELVRPFHHFIQASDAPAEDRPL